MLRRLCLSGLCLSGLCLLITACDYGDNFAPVTEAIATDPIPQSGIHRVAHGETLYTIAWRYGLDYRYLAKRNAMAFSSPLHSGQTLHLRGQERLTANRINYFLPNDKLVKRANFTWILPAKGKLLASFSAMHKGIDIIGREGQPIYAAAAGKVVYCGNNLRGYGNLIIIKHNALYLSAYAHNRMLYVNEGEWVKQGQEIAEMGDRGADKVMLHFEIRRAGRAIDPIFLLPRNI